MKIHSPNAHRKSAALKSDYFYNYFLIGMVSIHPPPPPQAFSLERRTCFAPNFGVVGPGIPECITEGRERKRRDQRKIESFGKIFVSEE